ncbi:2-phosphosulfolactate phosphatase [Paenibacillus sp. 1P03SA]|uniref:2-phosphosulfolactate phosphatase n=1 Tax=Paenibacillus sp. 1P03SA TaxID=3132294 RepID=UPI0039A13E6F
MRIDVIPTLGEVRFELLAGRTAIVIDVLRATTTITAALESGSSGVLPAESVQQAVFLRGKEDVLGGERRCRRIPGFDLGNSPLEYTPEAVGGRRVVLTTTNGTRALQKAAPADKIVAASLLNGEACAGAAADWKRDIAIVCAGTAGAFCFEDGLCAGLIVSALQRLCAGGADVCDLGRSLAACYERHADDPAAPLAACASGRRLASIGCEADTAFAARVNVSEVVPLLKDGVLVPCAPAREHLAR